jgi:4a-hydroxytetrahydrobiopterin dehydratase
MAISTPAHWQKTESQLSRTWKFDDFSAAWAFASRVALVAEKSGHHPEITVGWGQVTVITSTHEAGNTVTEKDQSLAETINKLS